MSIAKTNRSLRSAFWGCAAFLLVTAAANATPFGTLDITGVNGVIVGISTINFGGSVTTTGPDVFNYFNGTINTTVASGTAGTIQNLPPAPPVTGFMTFPGLTVNLSALAPTASAICSSTVFTNCALFAGSPFILNALSASSNASVTLNFDGTVADTSGSRFYTGSFTTQVNFTEAQIAAIISDGGKNDGTIGSSYSGTLTTTPEPGSIILLSLGGGLIGLGALRRRFTRSV